MTSAIGFMTNFVHDRPWISIWFLALGLLTATRATYTTISFFLQTFVIPGKSLNRFGAKKGAWALVTGATDGIGKEFAFQLAKAGFNVFLVARNSNALRKTSAEIAQTFPSVSTKFHSIDFAQEDEAAYDALAAECKNLDIGVLVNNVGKSHAMPAYFIDTPKDEIKDILAINVGATVRVTYAILPGMVERKRGLILNIGSFAGAVPSPMLATYSATKSFLATFSSALAEEVIAHKIVVEHVNTYFVVSKLSKIRKPSLLTPTPAPYVRAVLAKIDLSCGAVHGSLPGTSTPYWSHAVLHYAMLMINAPGQAIRYTHGLHKDIRRRALKKLEREAKVQ